MNSKQAKLTELADNQNSLIGQKGNLDTREKNSHADNFQNIFVNFAGEKRSVNGR